ncbi:DNA-directed RNA polymerases I, II, and III subunit RPABC3 [Irineochytrium annulatum]|nr:DNA-directed RNA polymerases I, II, and III subunit RPABC3 [Irineochytrium annulatum]
MAAAHAQLFSDIFEVNDKDKDGKKFDRVSRLGATSESEMGLILDVNTEIYPIEVSDKFTLTLTTSLSVDGSSDVGREAWRDLNNRKSLADDYDYVMFGKVYKFDDSGGRDRA